MDTLENLFSSDIETIEKLKGYAKQLDYKKIFFDHLGPELKKIFVNKKDKVCIKNFLEASQYEYGFFDKEIDLQKAFSLYKKYADLNDYLCMYKMHIIYLCEYEKFNVPFNRVLEKIYLLKCFAYLPNYIINYYLNLFDKINLIFEIAAVLDLEDSSLEKHEIFFNLLNKEKEKYNLSENDINLRKCVLFCFFNEKEKIELNKSLFIKLNSLKPTNDLDYAYYHSKNKCIFFQSYLNLGKFITDIEIENFYKEVINKKLYEFYSDYGNYLFDKNKTTNIEIIDILSTAVNKGDLFCCFRVCQSLIDYYDFDEIMSDYDKASNILDFLLDEIVFENLSKNQFVLLMGYLIQCSKFPEKIISKYLIYVKEINDYITSIINKEEKEEEESDEYNYIIKAYIYYFGFKGIEEQNLLKALEYLDKANNLTQDTYNEKFIKFIKYNIKKTMNELKMLTDEELMNEKKDLIEFYWNNLDLKNNIIDCYIIGEDYCEGIIKKQDQSISMLIYNSIQNISCKSFYDNKVKSEIKKFLKSNEDKHEIKFKDETCCICYEKKVNKIFIPCKHSFCSVCIDKLDKNSKCPICRSEILGIF